MLPRSTAIRSCRPTTIRTTSLNFFVTRRPSAFFSTNTNNEQQQESYENSNNINKQQPFVRTRLDPGEWDQQRRDPLYRPKFQSTARILHADDFARRPKVGYTGEFENFHDAMVTLTHLGQKQQNQIYDAYLSLMLGADAHHAGRTSHEYVYRVLGKQFQMTTERIAAIVLLKHNEERIKCEGTVPLVDDDVVAQIDAKFNNEIAEAYRCTGERPPVEFTEDPVGADGAAPPPNTKKYTVAPDLLDLERMTAEWTVREGRRARLIIDGHVYKEDQYDEDIQLPLSRAARQLLRQKERLAQKLANDPVVEEQRQKGHAVEPEWRTVGAKGKGERRPRWRYVAQVVDTRTRRTIGGKRHRGAMVNNAPENTVVECDGELRPGTLADCKTVAWKPKRDGLEKMIAPVRNGWLDRTRGNQPMAWGKAPDHVLAAHAAAKTAEAKEGDGEEPEEEAKEADAATAEKTGSHDDDKGEGESAEDASSDTNEPSKEEGKEDEDSKK